MAASPVALISADWHIKNTVRAYNRFAAFGDIDFSLQEVVRIWNDYEGLPLLLLGDIFDYRMVNGYAVHTLTQLSSLKHSASVYFILGQHDPANPPILDKVSFAHVAFFYLNGLTTDSLIRPFTIHFQDFVLPSAGDFPVQFEDGDVLMTHQVWKEFVPLSVSTWSVPEVAKGKRITIFSGDWHFPGETQVEGARLISPGPIRITDLGSISEKSVIVWYDDGSFKRLPVRTRKFINAFVKEKSEKDSLLEQLEKAIEESQELPLEISKPIFWIRVAADIFLDIAADLKAAIGDRAYLDISAIASASARRKIAAHDQAVRFRDAIDIFLQGRDVDNTIRDLAVRLWTASNPKEAVKEAVQVIMEDTQNAAED